jgi:hypothetical protein
MSVRTFPLSSDEGLGRCFQTVVLCGKYDGRVEACPASTRRRNIDLIGPQGFVVPGRRIWLWRKLRFRRDRLSRR